MLCHGAAGNTNSELYPIIAGQNVAYFTNQMKAFRDKTRADENAQRYMWGISSRLSDDDIDALANYFQAQTPSHYGKITDQEKYNQGSSIFNEGRAEAGVPACISCHGDKAQGNDTIPRLAGQHENYLRKQLTIFRGEQRPAAVAMHMVVNGLTPLDIDAIAYYLQAQ
jgi:cytochrome c553